MSEKLPISVIIPTFNRAKVLPRAIASVRAQTVQPFEIIVSDDFSTDETAEIARSLNVRVLTTDENQGSGPARNRAIEASQQTWIAFLDSDDAWEPNHLEEVWSHAKDFDLICSTAIDVDASGTRGRLRGSSTTETVRLEGPASAFLPENRIVTSSVLVKRKLVKSAGGFRDFRRAQDLDLWIRCLKESVGLLLSDVTVQYFRGDDQASNDRPLMRSNVGAILESHAEESWQSNKFARRLDARLQWDDFRSKIRERDFTAATKHLLPLALDPIKIAALISLLDHRRGVRRRTSEIHAHSNVRSDLTASNPAPSSSGSFLNGVSMPIRKAKILRQRMRGFVDLDQLKDRGMQVGEGVWFGAGSLIDPDFCHLIAIGENTVGGPNVSILAHDASMQRVLGLTKFAPVTIGSECFFGAGSIVLPGVTIGDRCIIGAGAVVRSDVPSNSLVIGNPAQIVGEASTYLEKQQTRIDAWIDLTKSKGMEFEDLSLKNVNGVLDKVQSDRTGYVI